jgi:hypothetical protein
MARAYSRDGTEPVKTRTVERNGAEFELPYCNICEAEMDGIRLGMLLLWKPGFKHTRKFPLKLGTFLCDICREEEGLGAEQYVMVPCGKDEDKLDALRSYIANLEAATAAN